MGFDLTTGDYITGWSPDILGSIGGWAVHGGTDGCVWAGGDFNRRAVGDTWRNGFVRWCDDAGQGIIFKSAILLYQCHHVFG